MAGQRGFPFAMSEGRDERQGYGTPGSIFREIERRYAYGGKFTLDPCAAAWSAKVPDHYFTEEMNGLILPWRAKDDKQGVAFVNPPWNDIGTWISKALREIKCGNAFQAVFCIPHRSDQVWWHHAKNEGARVIEPIGRINYEVPPGADVEGSGSFQPSAIVILERPFVVPDILDAAKRGTYA